LDFLLEQEIDLYSKYKILDENETSVEVTPVEYCHHLKNRYDLCKIIEVKLAQGTLNERWIRIVTTEDTEKTGKFLSKIKNKNTRQDLVTTHQTCHFINMRNF
jgi:hypothetical protein